MALIKSKSDDETDKLVMEVINGDILHHTVQFFHKTEKGLRPFGSGVLALVHETHFILTASHVADYLVEEENHLYIRVNRKNYINVLGDIKYTDIDKSKGIDLAYIKLDQQMIEPLSRAYKFLRIDKFRKHNKRLDGMNYCVIGFPEKNIRKENGLMETGANFYLTNATNEKPYDYYKFSKDDCHIVEMKGKGTDIKTGQTTNVDSHFYGISGCGLWYLIIHQNPYTKKKSIEYRLIGIMTQFRKGKYYCLIANKIHLVIEALHAIEGLKFKEIPVE